MIEEEIRRTVEKNKIEVQSTRMEMLIGGFEGKIGI